MSGAAELRALAERVTGREWHDASELRIIHAHNWLDAGFIEACTPARILSLLDAHDALIAAAQAVVRCKSHPATGSRLVLEVDLLNLERTLAEVQS